MLKQIDICLNHVKLMLCKSALFPQWPLSRSLLPFETHAVVGSCPTLQLAPEPLAPLPTGQASPFFLAACSLTPLVATVWLSSSQRSTAEPVFFVHSSVGGPCVHPLAVVNSEVLSQPTDILSFGCVFGMLARSVLFSVSQITFMLFSKMVVLISVPSTVCQTRLPQQCTRLSFSVSRLALSICSLFGNSLSYQSEVNPHCGILLLLLSIHVCKWLDNLWELVLPSMAMCLVPKLRLQHHMPLQSDPSC